MNDADAALRAWFAFWSGEIEFPWVPKHSAEIIQFPQRRRRKCKR